MKFLKVAALLSVFFGASMGVHGFSISLDQNKDGRDDRWLELDGKTKWKNFDTNGNNKADESIFYTNEKKMVYIILSEKIDYTQNGKPDIYITNTLKGRNFFSLIKIDSNADGKIDLVQYKENDVLQSQESDDDFDQKFDVFTEYYSNGKKKKEGNDQNGDGKPDDFYYFNKKGETEKQELDTNFDGKIDYWVQYEYDSKRKFKRCVIIWDSNYDGKPDEWHYTNKMRQVVKIEKDTNYDGKPDSVKNIK